MEGDISQAYDSQKISRSRKLRMFTKLLKEPIVVSGSAYRSGAHPVLAVRVAAEVARSPKRGLVEQLMEESRELFSSGDYPKAIVKSLAADELLRKYGGILAPTKESQIRDQLQFLKIQYFLLSGQAGEAYRALREVRHRSHPYLWHRRMAHLSGVPDSHWESVEKAMRQFFKTNRSGKIFALLGYAIALGSDPGRVSQIDQDLVYESSSEDRAYKALYKDYCFLTTRVTRRERDLFPEYLAEECESTPIIKEGNILFVGSGRTLTELQRKEMEFRTEAEIIVIPMNSASVKSRNHRLYEQ